MAITGAFLSEDAVFDTHQVAHISRFTFNFELD